MIKNIIRNNGTRSCRQLWQYSLSHFTYLFCNVVRLVLNSLGCFAPVKPMPIVSQLAIISYTRPSLINSLLALKTQEVNIVRINLILILILQCFSFESQRNLCNWTKNCKDNCSRVLLLSNSVGLPKILLSQIKI